MTDSEIEDLIAGRRPELAYLLNESELQGSCAVIVTSLIACAAHRSSGIVVRLRMMASVRVSSASILAAIARCVAASPGVGKGGASDGS